MMSCAFSTPAGLMTAPIYLVALDQLARPYDGNWKLQLENGADGYHVSSVHWNYLATMGHRDYENEGTKTVDANGWSKSVGGVYGFENGHILLWTTFSRRYRGSSRLGTLSAGKLLV